MEEQTLQDNVSVEPVQHEEKKEMPKKEDHKEEMKVEKGDEPKKGGKEKALYLVLGILFVLLLFALFAAVRLYTENQDLKSEVDTLDIRVTQLTAQVGSQDEVTPLPEDDGMDDTRPADGETPNEEDSDEYDVMYKYNYGGEDHTLVMDNPEGLMYKVETQEEFGQVLVVTLDEKTTLEVRLNDEGGDPGVYGEYVADVKGEIIRNRYFGDHYVLRADPGSCDFPTTAENPCVITLFHNDDDGMLSGYVRFEDQDQPEDNVPSDEALALADAMIASYRIE